MRIVLDEAEIRKAIENIICSTREHALFEFRHLSATNKIPYSAYFDNADDLIEELKHTNLDKGNSYITLNEVNAACFSREQKGKIMRIQPTTSDNDIVKYKWLFIDCDPERASGTSSSDEELHQAEQTAERVRTFLAERGFKEPIKAMSGNGYHLLYRIELDNTEKNRKTIENCLKVINLFCQSDKVKIDTAVSNPSRVCKLYGTYANKGSDTEERPHRKSYIVSAPEPVAVTSAKLLEELADIIPKDNFKPRGRRPKNYFDLVEWLNKYNIEVSREESFKGIGIKYILEHCPFDDSHTGKDACIIQFDNGALCFHCFHGHCSDYKWQDFRRLYEPDYDTKNDYFNDYENRYSDRYEDFVQPKEPTVFEDPLKNGYGLSELTEEDAKDPRFFVDGLIAAGLTSIVGASKVGKSTFSTQLASEIAIGGTFLGRQAHKTGVVYIDLEEEKNLVAQRTERQGYMNIPREDLCLLHELPENATIGQEFVGYIDAIRKSNPQYEVFIVDTLSRATGERKRTGEDAYNSDVKLISPIQRYAVDNNIAIILITHDSKASERTNDISKKQNGSTGLPSVADTQIYIARKNNQHSNSECTYKVISRKIQSIDGIAYFDSTATKFKTLAEDTDNIRNNPYMKYIIAHREDYIKSPKKITYKELFKTVFPDEEYKEKETAAAIKGHIRKYQDELFTEHGISILTQIRMQEGYGIEIGLK